MKIYKFIILLVVPLILCAFCSGCNSIAKTNVTSEPGNSESRMSLIKESDKFTNIYINNKFKFSVAYPKKWTAHEDVYNAGTNEQNASPDGGLNIFVKGKQDEIIYVYGQVGHIVIPEPDFQRDDFTTNSGLKGTLSSKEIDGKKVIYLILDEGFIGAYLNIKTEHFDQNKNEIISILRSINLIK
jgi:hypothetical protein